MPVAIKSSGGGSVTIAAASTASDFTATLQSATGTIPVVTPGTSGNLLTSDGTNWTSAAPAAPAAPDTQTFDTSGTWTKPAGYSANSLVRVQVWGGGGSGGRQSTTSAYSSGGGGGAYSSAWLPLSSFGSTETVTIGAGGASRTVNQTGATGGDTSIGSLVAAGGGGGGPIVASTASGGYLVGGVGSEFAGGNGGTEAVTNAFNSSSYYSGAGGGGVSDLNVARTGGLSRFGGNGGDGSLTTATAGTAPGGGGGGARGTSGAGAAGRVVITVYPA
jgi:hypothetical protein